MWWFLLFLIWWSGTAAIPSSTLDKWICPEINEQPIVECSCDMPHTLRCNGDKNALRVIGKKLRSLEVATVSLLDCTVQNVSKLYGPMLENVALHGLVISSGEIKDIHFTAFQSLAAPLQALGLPNNLLSTVPTVALKSLPELDRLDLSGNKIKSLDRDAFRHLRNLSFIDVSDNLINKISTEAFGDLQQLKVLRLRRNRLTLDVFTNLDDLDSIEELDVSENSLLGSLKYDTFPFMDKLKDLKLSHNSVTSVKKDALKKFKHLRNLFLDYNQIDVLEDNGFNELKELIGLDLSHNRIVAVSGLSLAHLTSLQFLDMRHNFLRALTADLIVPLKSLQKLRLDDNDISIITSDALTDKIQLQQLTLSENPLNCDCSLTEFATWLFNSSLSLADKSSPVCTTPPSLENGLLLNVSIHDLKCQEDEEHSTLISEPILTKERIKLDTLEYDGKDIVLFWNIDASTSTYVCDAIYIYEDIGLHEVQLETNSLKCNSSVLNDPKFLSTYLPNSVNLVLGHSYRYCLVLLESLQSSPDVSLILGCSDMLTLSKNIQMITNQIENIRANMATNGVITIDTNVNYSNHCEMNIIILNQNGLVHQKFLNCSSSTYSYHVTEQGPYRICVNLVNDTRNQCVLLFKQQYNAFSKSLLICSGITLLLCIIAGSFIWSFRTIRPKLSPHQCFLDLDLADNQQHNKYVKMHATTKL